MCAASSSPRATASTCSSAAKRPQVILALTMAATIHLGWHYVIDDFGGVAIGLAALAIALAMTGFEPVPVAQPRRRAGPEMGTA